MKVLDLQCAQGHQFEGWFGSEEDFQNQCANALVACPFCSNTHITKLISAPRLNLKAGRHSKTDLPGTPSQQSVQNHLSTATGASHLPHDAMQGLWRKVVDHMIKNTDDVGENFAEEARKIHYGEAPERGIRGQTSAQEAQELQEEGIDIMALPLPAGIKGPVQ